MEVVILEQQVLQQKVKLFKDETFIYMIERFGCLQVITVEVYPSLILLDNQQIMQILQLH